MPDQTIKTDKVDAISKERTQLTVLDVRIQLEQVLKDIHISRWQCSAYQNIESLYLLGELDENTLIPEGNLRVVVSSGTTEGYFIELIVDHKHENTMTPLIRIKYLGGRNECWNIGKIIDEVCYDGLFN